MADEVKAPEEEKKQYVLSISYGKDSLGCLGAIEQLGLPLDRIIHAEMFATDTISADYPEIVEFKKHADAIIKERWGIEVEHIRSTKIDGVEKSEGVSFQDGFYHIVQGERRFGEIKGFPLQLHPWCKKLKTRAIDRCNKEFMKKKNTVSYIGIAADEPERLARLDGVHTMAPLAMAGWTEADAYKWCEENDLLSPAYKTSNRTGCWFCNSQPLEQLRLLYHNYPELWEILLKWDNDSPITFKQNGHTVHDFDARFKFEDDGRVPEGRKFHWKMISPEWTET